MKPPRYQPNQFRRERDDPQDLLRTYFRLRIRHAFATRGNIFEAIQADWRETAPVDLQLIPVLEQEKKICKVTTNYGDFTYNLGTHRFTSPLREGEIPLSSGFERVILSSLLLHAPDFVSQHSFFEKTYGLPESYTMSQNDLHLINVHVSRLRKKIGDSKKDGEYMFIQTVYSTKDFRYKGGYRFNGIGT